MIIGVDAYYLFAEHIDGLGNYLLRLLKELSRIDRDNEYHLYTPGVTHAGYAEAIFSNPRFTLCEMPGIFRDKRRLWLQSPSLKKRILRDGIEFFFAGAEYFPLFLPRSITVATTIHDVAFKAMPEAISLTNSLFYHLFFPFFIRRADLFFTVSHHSKKEMMSYLGIDEKKISVIHNGIELEKFSPAPEGAKKDYILFVGTLQPRKNLVNLIQAFCRIAGRISDDLVIVGGSGWKNSPLRDLIEGLDEPLKKRIIFKGYVAGDTLAQLYREAKLFALPSLHEGFCLPILESMASGTAALTARSTAIPEIFGDAVAYADPLSPEDIGEKLYDLLANKKKRVAFQKQGLALSKQYDVRIQAAAYLSAFKQIDAGIRRGEQMNIVINARVLNERQGGPARYTMNVIRELAAIDRTNRYQLLLYDNLDFNFPLPDNFTVKIVRFRSKLFFDYLFIPLFSWFNRVDVFLFPKNTFSPLVRGKKIPVYHDIVYFEDFDFREFKFFDNLHHKMMIPVAARCSRIDLTVSDFTASRMKALLGIRPEKIRVIKEGVEPHFKKITGAKKLAGTMKKYRLKTPFFFYAGSLSPRKNMVNLIKGFIKIKDSIPHVIYFTGGESWLDTEVHDMITSNGLQDRIIKLGFISEEELVIMYNLADCYLYPSLYEGFGLPILEAQACGCPVITSNASSCPEVAGDGALYVDPRNADDIARAMLRIVTDKKLRNSLTAAGAKNCRRFTWEKTARGILDVFNECAR